MAKKLLFLFLLALFLLPSAAYAEFEFGGSYDNNITFFLKRDNDGIFADSNKLKLKLAYYPIPSIKFYAEPQYTFLIKTKDIPLIDPADIDKVEFNRAYMKIGFPAADLTVGKQRIAWGTGYVFHPTDIFVPFTLSFALAEEDRPAVDAIRLGFPLGDLSGFEGIILTDEEFSTLNKSKKGIKGKTNIGMYDLSLSYVALSDEGFQFGFDTAGELLGLGVRAEVAWINDNADEDYSTQAVLGWNYTFENGLGIDMEYFYNGEGEANKADYDWAGLLAGSIYQLGTQYLFLGFNYMIDEITTTSLSLLGNLNDSSFIVYPMYKRNIHENVDLSFEALITGGEAGSEYKPTDAEDPTGFLGGNTIFVKIKFSF